MQFQHCCQWVKLIPMKRYYIRGRSSSSSGRCFRSSYRFSFRSNTTYLHLPLFYVSQTSLSLTTALPYPPTPGWWCLFGALGGNSEQFLCCISGVLPVIANKQFREAAWDHTRVPSSRTPPLGLATMMFLSWSGLYYDNSQLTIPPSIYL